MAYSMNNDTWKQTVTYFLNFILDLIKAHVTHKFGETVIEHSMS